MSTTIRLSALLCVMLPLLSACDAFAGKKDYIYFRQHLDEAKSVADQCLMNGTSGMSAAQIKVCDIAREAYANRNLNY
ncbi:hypothetical protein ACIPEN_13650 [Herbaspirillum chlorophenolicum]|jgi:hypothetical protein|uniref:Lipoprotein n=1 Tax=Herbaspirillum chlorophenolicum TaxID=211589 RepID=A0ABW8F0Q2_9BURK|nr:hypothetical protein [Herbaspirillum chlorophenolicum]